MDNYYSLLIYLLFNIIQRAIKTLSMYWEICQYLCLSDALLVHKANRLNALFDIYTVNITAR